MWTFLNPEKLSTLAMKIHPLALSPTCMRKKSVTDLVMHSFESAQAPNAFINNLDGNYRSILQSNTSFNVSFSAILSIAVSINR